MTIRTDMEQMFLNHLHSRYASLILIIKELGQMQDESEGWQYIEAVTNAQNLHNPCHAGYDIQ